jgi:hypothetical protein
MPRRRSPDETQALQETLLAGLRHGQTISQIARHNPKICRRVIHKWRQLDPEFADAYARAREDGLESMAEDLVSIADDTTGDPARDRLRLDTRKWLLARLAAQRYGDRVAVTGHQDAPPIQITDTERASRIAAILEAAAKRVAE